MATAVPGRRSRFWHGVAVPGALGVLAIVSAACGGGSPRAVASLGTTTSTTNAPAAGSGPAPGALGSDIEKFVSCIRSHGVAGFPEPVVSGNSVSLRLTPAISGSPHFASAQATCQHLLPGKPTNQNFSTQQQADYLKAAACMRSHGIVGFPDPDFSGGGVRFPLPAGMSANSKQFEAAREICQKLIPQGLPYSN